MEIRTGFPFRGKMLNELRSFLAHNGLRYDQRVSYSLCFVENDVIAATGSLDHNVLKCIAVSKDFQERGLAAGVVSGLIEEAARNGVFHLVLFTTPENELLFGNLGFYTIAKTADVLLMENKKNGVSGFVASLQRNTGNVADTMTAENASRGVAGKTGAIVMNCNPFTNGHRYLIETAAKQCGILHVFVVSENRSVFPADVRYRLVKAGSSHIPHALIHPTGSYLISAATFPDYFFKDTVDPQSVNTTLDLTIFAEHFARPMGINCRFVGTEPFDQVTAGYNRRMQEVLPHYAIEVIEIDRLEEGGRAISAGRVRELYMAGKMEEIREMVPEPTFELLNGKEAVSC